jgi:hypothetical protein
MVRRTAAVAALLLASLGWRAEGAPSVEDQPRDKSIVIVNETGQTIMYLYAYSSFTEPWLEDALGDQVIEAGQAITLHLGKDTSCRYTFQAELRDGTKLDYDRYDVCEHSSLHVKA